MDERSRARSLPSLRLEAAKPTKSSIPILPPHPSTAHVQHAKGTGQVSFSNLTTPAWDREVDITFHKKVPGENFSQNISFEGNNNKIGALRATFILEPKKENNGLQQHISAATASAIRYTDGRKDTKDAVLKGAINGLKSSRKSSKAQDEGSFLFRLPENVRRRIWCYVVCEDPEAPPKPIRLQVFNPFFKDVWLPNEFQSTYEIFAFTQGAMYASSAMRVDLFAYLLTTHRFHFIFSPYTKERVCPQMFHWIDHYSQLMEYITVEIDLSKLGFGPTQEAGDLLWGNKNTDNAIRRFIDVQDEHRSKPLENLVLLARRYHGLRPTLDDAVKGNPYCPPEADFTAAAPFIALKDRINTIRIAGFNSSTSNTLISSLFPSVDCTSREQIQRHGARAGISRIWPFLDGQASVHRDETFPRKSESHHISPRPSSQATNRIHITPSRKVIMAKNHIAKLKEMLEAYEVKRQRSRESSMELDNEATLQSMKQKYLLTRHSTTRINSSGSNGTNKIDTRRPSRVTQDKDLESLKQPGISTENEHIYPNMDCIGPQNVEVEGTNPRFNSLNSDSGTIATLGNKEMPNYNTVLSGGKRTSETSSLSLRSKQSVRWSEEQVDHGRFIPEVFQSTEKTARTPIATANKDQFSSAKNLNKKTSTKELRRKKSFIDFFRGGGQRRSDI